MQFIVLGCRVTIAPIVPQTFPTVCLSCLQVQLFLRWIVFLIYKYEDPSVFL